MIFPAAKKTLWQLIGPSVVFVALSLNGGETLLWPDLVGRYSLTILWAVPLILFLQFMVNLEIERYSIVTGKNTLAGMIQKSSWLSALFIFGIIVSLAWPAWASVSGNILAYVGGVPAAGAWLAILVLALQILVWQSKRSYEILENIARAGLLVILGIGIFVIIRLWPEVLQIKLSPTGFWPTNSDKILFLSALAFGGVAGVLNLVQSNWVINKGYGINTELKSGETRSEDKFQLSTESPAKSQLQNSAILWNSESIQNFKNWWNLIWKEHFILFYIGNFIGIGLIAIVSAVLLPGSGRVGFGILTFEVDKLNSLFYGVGFAWALGIFILFFMAQLTILDAIGRLLKSTGNKLFENTKPERLSQFAAFLGIIILFFTAVIPGFNQPASLLQISASTSALIMALYPPLLLGLNQQLPEAVRPKLFNIVSVWACVAFYSVMFVLAFV